jgi:KaiC/GvpD/RAD55 family RecA-like ATPase
VTVRTPFLLIGAAGVGKSSLALTYAVAAARRGEHAAIFAFDEGRGTIDARATAIDGRQVADAARERRPKLKVLFITGYAAKRRVRQRRA